MLIEEETEKKPERSAKRKQTRRDRRIERILLENRDLKLRIRKLEDRLKEPMRQLVARKREEKERKNRNERKCLEVVGSCLL